MNHLAHLYLAERTGTSFAGNFLGDFVRGRLGGRFDPAIETGIRLHRRVDSYADSHPLLAEARDWFPPPYRRYAGILLDVYFDHLLIRHWRDFHDEPVDRFVQRATTRMRREWPAEAPFAGARLAGLPDALCAYARPRGVEQGLYRVHARLARPSPLREALPLLVARDAELDTVFRRFLPDLVAFGLDEISVR